MFFPIKIRNLGDKTLFRLFCVVIAGSGKVSVYANLSQAVVYKIVACGFMNLSPSLLPYMLINDVDDVQISKMSGGVLRKLFNKPENLIRIKAEIKAEPTKLSSQNHQNPSESEDAAGSTATMSQTTKNRTTKATKD